MIDYILPFFFLASGMTANKLILKSWSPGFLVAIRMLSAGVILLSIALFKGKNDFIQRIKKQWLYLLLLSSFAAYIPALLKAYAFKHTLSSKVALINSLDPFLTALYMYVLFSERLTWKKWCGILLGFTGSLVIIFSTSAADANELLGISMGELAAFGTVIISRYGWIKIQQLLKSQAFSVKEINGITMFCAGIYSLIGTLVFTPEAFKASLDLYNLSLLAYTIVGGNLIGYTLYSQLLKKHSAIFVALAGMTTPLFVYIFGWLVVGEKLYPSFWISSAITFAGLLLFYRDELKEALAQ